nr:hypothetical protein Iba_chr02bCG18240 [Ipomoea batatas]
MPEHRRHHYHPPRCCMENVEEKGAPIAAVHAGNREGKESTAARHAKASFLHEPASKVRRGRRRGFIAKNYGNTGAELVQTAEVEASLIEHEQLYGERWHNEKAVVVAIAVKKSRRREEAVVVVATENTTRIPQGIAPLGFRITISDEYLKVHGRRATKLIQKNEEGCKEDLEGSRGDESSSSQRRSRDKEL